MNIVSLSSKKAKCDYIIVGLCSQHNLFFVKKTK